MQTTTSLQEEPRGTLWDGVAEEPRAQTGLRGGKLARIIPESPGRRPDWMQAVDYKGREGLQPATDVSWYLPANGDP